jgi:type IV secretory pathway protease TraF
MKSPNRIVTIMLFGLATIAVAAGTDPAWRLVYNPSESAPRGWYALIPAHHPTTGDWVLAHLPKPIAQLADERSYLPIHVPILKRIAAQKVMKFVRLAEEFSSTDTSLLNCSKTTLGEGPWLTGAHARRSKPKSFSS